MLMKLLKTVSIWCKTANPRPVFAFWNDYGDRGRFFFAVFVYDGLRLSRIALAVRFGPAYYRDHKERGKSMIAEQKVRELENSAVEMTITSPGALADESRRFCRNIEDAPTSWIPQGKGPCHGS